MQWRLSDSTRAYVEQTLRETAMLQARIAALEAAARAVAAGCWSDEPDPRDRDNRHWCRYCEYRAPDHAFDCEVAALAGLLDGDV